MPGSESKSASVTSASAAAEPRPLSGREREVLGLLAEGLSGAAIAERLVLSPETVRTHVRNAMDKLGASTRSQAVVVALERGEIGDQEAGGAGVAARRSAARAAATPEALGATLTALLGGLVSLADVETAAIYLTEDGGMGLRIAGSVATEGAAPVALDSEVTLGHGPLGRLALERRTQLVAGLGGTGLAAPMVADGRLIGLLMIGTRPSRPASRRELLLLEAFAARLGEILGAGGDLTPKLRMALQRFRASWTGSLAR